MWNPESWLSSWEGWDPRVGRGVPQALVVRMGFRTQPYLCESGICACSVASVVSDSLRHYGLSPTRFLNPWDSAGKNTGVGCHAFLQGFFFTQGWNLHLLCPLHWRQIPYRWAVREALWTWHSHKQPLHGPDRPGPHHGARRPLWVSESKGLRCPILAHLLGFSRSLGAPC